MLKFAFKNHPELLGQWTTYCTIDDFTDGSVDRVKNYLWRYVTEADGSAEGDAHYKNRQMRLYNKNFCDRPLFLHLGHLSQSMAVSGIAEAEAGKDMMAEILQDVSGFGHSFTKMSRDRLWYYMRDGRVATLVDSPPDAAANKALQDLLRQRSFQVNYQAKQIRYWDRFMDGPRKGQYREVILESSLPLLHASKKHLAFWRFFIEEGSPVFSWQHLMGPECSSASMNESEIITEVISQGDGALEEIPVVIWGDGPEESFIKDVVPLNIAHLNHNSILSNVLYNTGFQRTIIAGARREQVSKVGEHMITLIDRDGVQVFTINPGDPGGLESEVLRLEQRMERVSKFETNQMADDSRQTQSAESKAKDLVARKAIYDATLDDLENIERKIYQLHAIYEAADPALINVSISREYGLEDPTAEQQALQLAFTNARELGVLALQKEILKLQVSKLKLLPGDGLTREQVQQRIFEAIDLSTGPQQPSGIGDILAGVSLDLGE